jgi:hypothetical protein
MPAITSLSPGTHNQQQQQAQNMQKSATKTNQIYGEIRPGWEYSFILNILNIR